MVTQTTDPVETVDSLLAAGAATLDEQLRRQPPLANLRLDRVGTIRGQNSEILEYRVGNQSTAPGILVKHILGSRCFAVAKENVTREFAALESVRRSFSGPFLDTIPEPIALLLEARAMVRTKLPGSSLKRILQRDANLVCGRFLRLRIVKIAGAAGGWLRLFHDGTSRPDLLHDHQALTDELTNQLRQCKSNGFGGDLLERVLKSATFVSKKLEGQPVPAAARHGDFIPENILVDGNSIGVVDFQNFAQCDVVYKDLSSFVTYLTIMAARSYYNRPALQSALENFHLSYDRPLRDDLMTLYNLISMARLAAGTRRRAIIRAGPAGFKPLEKQLVEYSRQLLQL